jgi:predicted nucleic acid-binding protein
MIVADAGPIIAFVRIGRLDLLQEVFGELVIPEAVYADLVVKGKPGASDVERSRWIHRKAVTNRAALAGLPSYLHAGEREALVASTSRFLSGRPWT